MSSVAALLSLHGAAFGYESRAVVSEVDLTVEPGMFLGILGPNGAGKTTLFRGLLGLIPPLAGTVERSHIAIGYVPQRETLDAIYPLTVEEVVHMGSYGRLRGWRGLPTSERALARQTLARVGLEGREHAMFNSLSGGQRQRALIARALMARPEVLLLDEPRSGVDHSAQTAILDLLRELNTNDRLAILLVSHQLGLVRDAVQEALWVADGRVQHGSAQELLTPERLDELFEGGASSDIVMRASAARKNAREAK
jgi:ABC-type Mn2+/Zn2+ transport system ATPase subunit